MRNDWQSEPNKVVKYITEWNKDRYQEYQKWVVVKCQETLNEYQKEKKVTNEDADRLFKFKWLFEIKADLLTPEVSAIYNDILQKLYAEMNWNVKAFHEKECAIGKKITLEDK